MKICCILAALFFSFPPIQAQQYFNGTIEYSFTRFSESQTAAVPNRLTIFYQGDQIKLLPDGLPGVTDSLWVLLDNRADSVYFFNATKRTFHREHSLNARGDYPEFTRTDSIKIWLGHPCRKYVLKDRYETDIAGYVWLAEDLDISNGKDFVHHPMAVYFGGKQVMLGFEMYHNGELLGIMQPEHINNAGVPANVFDQSGYRNEYDTKYNDRPKLKMDTARRFPDPEDGVYIIKDVVKPVQKKKTPVKKTVPKPKAKPSATKPKQ